MHGGKRQTGLMTPSSHAAIAGVVNWCRSLFGSCN